MTGDEACGGNPKLRRRLEERRLPYVMAVACSEPVIRGLWTDLRPAEDI